MKGVAIGAGYFSRFQYEAWTRIGEVEIAAICDRAEEKARAMMAKFGIPRYYSDWREMIRRESPDFIDIAIADLTPQLWLAFGRHCFKRCPH
jgi:predicted dehydrogenase